MDINQHNDLRKELEKLKESVVNLQAELTKIKEHIKKCSEHEKQKKHIPSGDHGHMY